jgi:hypothetical protein
MAQGIRFHETGGPEVLRWESFPVGERVPATCGSGTRWSA